MAEAKKLDEAAAKKVEQPKATAAKKYRTTKNCYYYGKFYYAESIVEAVGNDIPDYFVEVK